MPDARTDAKRSKRRSRRATTPLGAWVRELRESRGMSSSRLSVASGLSRTYVSALELGRAIPKRETVTAIAESLNCSAAERAEFYRRAIAVRPRSISSDELLAIVGDCPTCRQRIDEALQKLIARKQFKRDGGAGPGCKKACKTGCRRRASENAQAVVGPGQLDSTTAEVATE